jgi:hypothetical protein
MIRIPESVGRGDVYTAGGRANRGAYDYSDHHSAARVCASIPAGAVPDVLGPARGGRDSFLDCPTLAIAAQRALTLSSIALACMAGAPTPINRRDSIAATTSPAARILWRS